MRKIKCGVLWNTVGQLGCGCVSHIHKRNPLPKIFHICHDWNMGMNEQLSVYQTNIWMELIWVSIIVIWYLQCIHLNIQWKWPMRLEFCTKCEADLRWTHYRHQVNMWKGKGNFIFKYLALIAIHIDRLKINWIATMYINVSDCNWNKQGPRTYDVFLDCNQS